MPHNLVHHCVPPTLSSDAQYLINMWVKAECLLPKLNANDKLSAMLKSMCLEFARLVNQVEGHCD